MGMISGDERLGNQPGPLIVCYCLLHLPSAALQEFGTGLGDLPTSRVSRCLTSVTLIKLYRECSGFLVAHTIYFKFRKVTVGSLVLSD